EKPVGRVLESRGYCRSVQTQRIGQFPEIALGNSGFGIVVGFFRRDEVRVFPDGLAILAPIEREGPARQGFARIPFALTVMEEAAPCEALLQAADEDIGFFALGGAD